MKVMAFALLVAAGALLLAAPALAQDATVVHGVLSDDAVVQKAVTDASVTIGGIAATVDGQDYTATRVPVGIQTMVVTAPRHAPLTRLVTVVPGDNTIDVMVGLTVKETYLRYYAAYNHGRFSTAWQMVHPDVRNHLVVWGRPLTFKLYRWYLRSWNLPFPSMRIVGIRSEATWRPDARARLEHRVYHDLTHITRVVRYKYDRICTDRCWIHWQNISGRWYTIFDRPWNCR